MPGLSNELDSEGGMIEDRGVPGYRGFTQEGAVLAAFGRPARTYHVGAYTVLVWHGNLLRKLG